MPDFLTRNLVLDASRADDSSRTVPVTVSTDAIIERSFYREKLEHDAKAIDLARSPLPLVVGHDTSDAPIGVVEDLKSDGRRLTGRVRFGASARARELFADVKSKVLRSVSIGYRVLKVVEETDKTSGECSLMRITKWEPLEVSIVAVPADISAQFYRSLKMPKQANPATEDEIDDRGVPEQSRRQRAQAREVVDLCTAYGFADRASDFLERGLDVDQAAREILKLRATDPVKSTPRNPLQNDSEQTRAIQSEFVDRAGEPVAILTRDQRMSDLHPNPDRLSFGGFIRAALLGDRRDARYTRALGEASDGAGGFFLSPTVSADLIDALRAQARVVEAGARVLPVESSNVRLVRLESDPAAAWHAENQADIPESSPQFGAVHLRARTLIASVRISRELLADAPNAEVAIRQAFAQKLALELDRVALFGTGAENEPLGIANVLGTNVVSLGVNGGPLTSYTPFNQALRELALDNASPARAAIMSPRTQFTVDELKDTTGQPLQRPKSLESLQMFSSTQVGDSDTQGSASNASRVFVADYSKLLIGMLQSLQIDVLRESQAHRHQYELIAHMRCDVALERPQHFCQIVGIIP